MLHYLFSVIAILLFLAILAGAIFMRRNRRYTFAANAGLNGTHAEGLVPRFASAPIAEKYLLGKKGADDNTVAVCTAITDLSQGVLTDEARAAGDPINLALHAGAAGTRLVRVNVNVVQDDELIPAANARAGKLAGAAPGTYYPFGRVLTSCAAGGVAEYAPCPPIPRVLT